MIEKEIFVSNPKGLHARPSAVLTKTATQFQSDIHLIKEGFLADAKNVMSILTLCAPYGTKLTLKVSGTDEEMACTAIEEVFALRFDDA